MRIPSRGKIYSFNEANRWDWDTPLQEYVTALQTGQGETGKTHAFPDCNGSRKSDDNDGEGVLVDVVHGGARGGIALVVVVVVVVVVVALIMCGTYDAI